MCVCVGGGGGGGFWTTIACYIRLSFCQSGSYFLMGDLTLVSEKFLKHEELILMYVPNNGKSSILRKYTRIQKINGNFFFTYTTCMILRDAYDAHADLVSYSFFMS